MKKSYSVGKVSVLTVGFACCSLMLIILKVFTGEGEFILDFRVNSKDLDYFSSVKNDRLDVFWRFNFEQIDNKGGWRVTRKPIVTNENEDKVLELIEILDSEFGEDFIIEAGTGSERYSKLSLFSKRWERTMAD